MALKIVWSKRADKKFDKIIEYLNEDFGEGVTKSFVRKVYDFLDILSEFPEIGSIENRERGIRGLPPPRPTPRRKYEDPYFLFSNLSSPKTAPHSPENIRLDQARTLTLI